MDMRKEHSTLLVLALLAGLLPPVFTGCGKVVLDPSNTVTVPLAMAVSRPADGLETKMAESIVQLNTTTSPFRGIQQPYMIPFAISNTDISTRGGTFVLAGDLRGAKISVPGITKDFADDAERGAFHGLVNNNNSHLYSSAVIPQHTNAVLVYAQAINDATYDDGTVPFKKRNGVVLHNNALDSGTGTEVAGEILFDLEPFISSTDTQRQAEFTDWKTANINMLNGIASTSLNNQAINLIDPTTYGDDALLRSAFEAYTGGGRVFSGSDASIGYILTALYGSCKTASSSATTDNAKALAAAVVSAIEAYTQPEYDSEQTLIRPAMISISEGKVTLLSGGAPGTFGLPDGVASLRWNSNNAFYSPTKSDGVNIATIDAYCYPPALWYYANSQVMGCTKAADVLDTYVSTKSWNEILTKYTQSSITMDTYAAVIKDPLQYAVAQLRMTLTRTSTFSSADYPLTGIIIGNQRTQQFDFTPLPSGSGGKEYFLYDSEVSDTPTIYTLTFETLAAEDVRFALEFRNNTATDLTGVRGCKIRPGTKFYLVGTMSYTDLTPTQKAQQASVFAKDHYTNLNVSFVNMALYYCYDLLPELKAPDLQIGLDAKLNWDASTPTTVPIK